MRNRLQLITLIILVFALTSCGSADVKVWSMAPAEATNQASTQEAGSASSLAGQETSRTYTNDIYGFSFTYPSEWTLSETSNWVSIVKDGVALNISFKRTTEEDVNILPSGMPAGDVIKGNPAEIYFLGKSAPKSLIQLDGVTQTVMYGNGARQVGQMEFFVQADISDFQVATEGIPADLEAEMDDVVKSLDLVWVAFPLSDEAMEEWNTYTNDDYGFIFRYPSTWKIDDTISSNSLILQRDDYELFIAFRNNSEDVQIMPSGMSAGEFQKGDPIFVMLADQEVERIHLVYADRLKSIIYLGEDAESPFELGDLELVAFLNGQSQLDYDSIDLPIDIRDEADAILASLELTEDVSVDE